jgi:alpha-2-macroglobulin
MKSLLSFVLLFLIIDAIGQDLLSSRKSSYYTYIFKITDKDARKIYQDRKIDIEKKYLYNLVDSFPGDSAYEQLLEPGHYLKVSVRENRLNFYINTVYPLKLEVIDNKTDLILQVFDLKGIPLKDAVLKIGGRKIPYDKKIQAFLLRKSNQKGFVCAIYEGNNYYFDLTRQYNNPGIKRVSRKMVYSTPLKYAWIPVNYIAHLPVDGFKSIIKGYPYGSINWTKRFFVNLYENFACLVDGSYCDDYKFSQKYSKWFVYSKPKYLPGDTVKFKAYISKRNGKPISQSVDVVFTNGNYKNFKLTKLSPYKKGAFSWQFFLHDSLDLKLDKNCKISLMKRKGKSYISSWFAYEDYELSGIKLDMRTPSLNHYKGIPFEVFVQGKDINGLNLPDGRIQIFLKSGQVHEYFDSTVFIPDTLFFYEKLLEPARETKILIPDSVFPPVNMSYDLELRLLTSDNDFQKKNLGIEFYYRKKDASLTVENDTMKFDYFEDGVNMSCMAEIYAIDGYGNDNFMGNTALPFRQKINPYFTSYRIKAGSLNKLLSLSARDDKMDCYSERNSDSVSFRIYNPAQIPITYFIYHGNREIARGTGSELDYHQKSLSAKDYILSIQYLWGGKMETKNFLASHPGKNLKIEVEQPQLVYPGQKTRISVKVSNPEGKPVPGVDLTAYGLTNKFDSPSPEIPDYSKKRKGKELINSFTLHSKSAPDKLDRHLNYEKWKKAAGLDSIAWYQFLYPGQHLYRYEYETPDGITQFAPFVMKNGKMEKVHVIYLDHLPVYFSWAQNLKKYSFRLDSGFHQLKIRTSTDEYLLDSIHFRHGVKTILSFTDSLQTLKNHQDKLKRELNNEEKSKLFRYMMPYRANFGVKPAYVYTNNNYINLKPERNYNKFLITGPVYPGATEFHLIDGFKTDFSFEPFFEYEFNPGLLKMRTYDFSKQKWYLHSFGQDKINDRIFQKQDFEKEYMEYLERTRYNYLSEMPRTFNGYGNTRLQIHFDGGTDKKQPLFILGKIYGKQFYLRILPDITYTLQIPGSDYLKLVLILENNQYAVIDSIFIRSGGLNYYRIISPAYIHQGVFNPEEEQVKSTLEYLQVKGKKEILPAEEPLDYKQMNKKNWQVVKGIVLDDEGMALPGVSVRVKGTQIGTITDINGAYTLAIPDEASELVFSFIGMKEFNEKINGEFLEINMEEENLALEEVVVTAYGMTKKSNLTASVSTISVEEGLSGKVAGVKITSTGGIPGAFNNLVIRGTSSIADSGEPLYVIDGVVYIGSDFKIDPSMVDKVEVLKGSGAAAIYGSRAANGVVLISTRNGFIMPKSKGADYDQDFYTMAMSENSIRKNYSDVAFWQPKLKTNEKGQAEFEVTFPDDVTGWDTHYIAIGKRKMAGRAGGFIRSYKPLMANLSVPRFLVSGDSAGIIGKVRNYTPDTLQVTTTFEMNDSVMTTKSISCSNSAIDTFYIHQSMKDSLRLKFFLTKNDGYFDGEQREIPVFPSGLKETKGQFFVLDGDTSISPVFDQGLSTVTLYAKADELDILKDEISYLIGYKYACNEQLASKLKAMLALKQISEARKEKFKYEKEIGEIIARLLKNRQDNGMWGWWNKEGSSSWISLHVLEALVKAKEMGFPVKLDIPKLTDDLIWKLQQSNCVSDKIRIIRLLKMQGISIDLPKFLRELDQEKDKTLYEIFSIIELKQMYGIPVKTDTIFSYAKRTLFGNLYFASRQSRYFYENEVQNALLAYRIIRRDTSLAKESLVKIRNFLFENRRNGSWLNTYESALVMETLLPEIIQSGDQKQKAVLHIRGDINKTIEKFPFEMKLKPGDQISINKTGLNPVYLATYQKYHNPLPVAKSNDFIISTAFRDHRKAEPLSSGKSYTLVATLQVKKDAEYVMIEIPVPASCSYNEKSQKNYHEVHREYFKEKVAIFCDYLKEGTYKFEIEVIPRYTGKYTMNPAKVELMYFPVFNANNEIQSIKVK